METTNIILCNQILVPWVWSLFIRAHKKDLEFSDLYRCPKSDETHLVRHKLEIKWDKQLKSKRKPSLFWALFASFGPELFALYIPDAIRDLGFNLLRSYCIVYLVRYFNDDPNTSQWWAIWAAVGIVLAAIAYMFITHLNLTMCSKVGVTMRAACCALIYRKSMRLSHSSLGQTTVGQILNIMSNDVNRFDQFALYSRALFVGPLQVAIVLYLLWPYLRWACLTGMGILVLFIPFQVLMGRMFRNIRQKTAKLTDSRIRLMQEIIAGMRVIKMYAWEQPFAQLVSEARKSEVKQIRVNLSIYFVIIRVIIYACFLTYILMGGMLSAETAFATMAYFNAMQWSIGLDVSMAITALSELIIVIRRIQTFLLLEEMSGLDEREGKDNEAFISGENEIILGVMENTSSNEEKGVFMDKMSVRWNNETTEPTLRDISLSVKTGQLLAVVGSVGSGKSSLLMAILNEISVVSGRVVVRGRVSYAPQESWAFIASVRQNILTNKMSGGQKARLSLARALYHSADIYLLDDPLSAVDTHVAKHLFQKYRCCVEYLKDKTRVLVTHSIVKEFLRVVYEHELLPLTHRRTSLTPSMVSSLSEGSVVTDVREPIEVDEQEVKPELKMIGSVETNVYMDYIKAGAGPLLFSIREATNKMSETSKDVYQTFNIIIYTSLTCGLFVSALLSTICFYIMCMRSSVNLYNRIFYALLRSPIHLFERRILNRFSKDTGIVDELLPSVAFEFIIGPQAT
ncbi:unnamed protein product [Medioppia subpectinata]|uniref:Uncharacterized protein n=1 Tax=Medioppia subpectinata TaxID=1979941 RepID=A0A7R9PXP9_9ACAR|nr:unnamed protein product [Medioppia subpectinata]CAG2104614.1 unnamed protein product [Medioppia subpectinata]